MPRPVKRSFTIDGHRTSISLESAFWQALKDVAKVRGLPVAQLVQDIDRDRGEGGLSSAVRIWLLNYFRDGATGATPPEAGGRRGSSAVRGDPA